MTRVNPLLLALFLPVWTAAQTPISPLFLDTTNADIYATKDETTDLALGDIDGDGDLDMAVANGYFQPATNRILLNTGKGRLEDYTTKLLPANLAMTRAVVLGDLDGDKDLDLVTGNRGSRNMVYLNDGKGAFTLSPNNLPDRKDATEDILLLDVEGDGDLDLVVVNDLGQDRLYLNDGKALFTDVTATSLPAATDSAWDAEAADIDGDGDLDFVVVKWGPGQNGQNRLYRNNGKGQFTDATSLKLPTRSDATFAIALGDLDGDSDPDMVLGQGDTKEILLNDGYGHFKPTAVGNLPPDPQLPFDLLLADLDEDGDLDLVVANLNTGIGLDRLFLNNGKGVFRDATFNGLPLTLDGSTCLAAGDLDGDGDLDLVTGNTGTQGEQNLLFRNLTRQVHAPDPLLIGRTYKVDVYTRPDQGNPLLIVMLLMAADEKPLKIDPFGTLGLDLVTLVAFPPRLADPLTRHATYSFPVPNYTGITGARLFYQALVENQRANNKQFRFTNVGTDILTRP